jgi:signal transduction histidine kinase
MAGGGNRAARGGFAGLVPRVSSGTVHMNPIHWQRPKWLPRLLSMPVPEPAEQASRILAMQRNIVLPVKLIVSGIVLYYLFYGRGIDISPGAASSSREVFFQFLQQYFIFYIIFNAIAAILLLLRRFPPGLVQWVVFTVGLVDGLLLAGLTMDTGGWGSPLFWVFPGLIVVNALSIPLATPQMVLNLLLCLYYLSAGFVEASVTNSANLTLPPDLRVAIPSSFLARDIINLEELAAKLKHPASTDYLSQYLAGQLSRATLAALSNYNGGTNSDLQRDLAEDFSRIIKKGSLYDEQRFAGVHLSPDTSILVDRKLQGQDQVKLNRKLLLEAYPLDLSKSSQFMREAVKVIKDQPQLVEQGQAETETEPWVLRLIILLLLTVSCYGVQLLSFRQRISEEEERKSTARNDELKAAGRLAAEIAHQLKNPLGIINNAAYSMQRGMKEGRNDFSQQMGIIREEIDRADLIITQLMGYAQLSEGRVEKLDLVEEFERAVLEVFPPGTSYEVDLHRDYGANLPALLMQRTHLSVVLVNLLQNAREAMDGKGRIDIRAHYGNADTVQLIISDNGPGISPDKLGKVFEAYFSSKPKGTGLGLAIVKHNVELYGGAVRVESELGKGARFVLVFPAKTFIITGS